MPAVRCGPVSLAAAAANSECNQDAGRDSPGVLVWAAPSISLSSGRGERDEPLSPAKHAHKFDQCFAARARRCRQRLIPAWARNHGLTRRRPCSAI